MELKCGIDIRNKMSKLLPCEFGLFASADQMQQNIFERIEHIVLFF